MAREEYDLELRRYDGLGWREIFPERFEHSLTSHAGAAWAHSPWEAVQRLPSDQWSSSHSMQPLSAPHRALWSIPKTRTSAPVRRRSKALWADTSLGIAQPARPIRRGRGAWRRRYRTRAVPLADVGSPFRGSGHTLEQRLGESLQLVSERLEQVHRGDPRSDGVAAVSVHSCSPRIWPLIPTTLAFETGTHPCGFKRANRELSRIVRLSLSLDPSRIFRSRGVGLLPPVYSS
jgi:hypothetical protein